MRRPGPPHATRQRRPRTTNANRDATAAGDRCRRPARRDADVELRSAASRRRRGRGRGRGGLSQAELDELVASSDTGGRSATGHGRRVPDLRGAGLVAVPALDRLAASRSWSASACSTTPRRARSTWPLPSSWPSPPFPAARTPFQLALGIVIPVALAALFMIGAKDGVSDLVDPGGRGWRWSPRSCSARPRTASRSGNGRWRSWARRRRSISSSTTRRSRAASARRSLQDFVVAVSA